MEATSTLDALLSPDDRRKDFFERLAMARPAELLIAYHLAEQGHQVDIPPITVNLENGESDHGDVLYIPKGRTKKKLAVEVKRRNFDFGPEMPSAWEKNGRMSIWLMNKDRFDNADPRIEYIFIVNRLLTGAFVVCRNSKYMWHIDVGSDNTRRTSELKYACDQSAGMWVDLDHLKAKYFAA